MIKILTGELVPQTGEVWKHPNARVAYVAQHAFHHIENHLNKTPNEYIRWRYANGEDKESLVKVSMVLTEDEGKLQKEPFEVVWKDDDGKTQKANKVVVELTGSRRENKQKEYEYEVKYRDGSEGYLSIKILSRRGWEKATKGIDSRIAQRSGLYIRTLSAANVEKHLSDCGLEAEFATHYRMSALSGGQKVKGAFLCFCCCVCVCILSLLCVIYLLHVFVSRILFICRLLIQKENSNFPPKSQIKNEYFFDHCYTC